MTNPTLTCAFSGCGKESYVRGYCNGHYRQLMQGKELKPLQPRIPQPAECVVESCITKPHARGYCKLHLNRVDRYGRTERVREQHDPDAICSVTGCDEPVRSLSYCLVHYMRVRRHGDRLVMAQMIGRPLHRFEEPHHKNGLRNDNRPENLELWVKWRQPNGQRLSDLLAFIADYYPDEMRAELEVRHQQPAQAEDL